MNPALKLAAGATPHDSKWGHAAPTPSADLNRILTIPERDVSEAEKLAMCELMTQRLARPPNPDCICKSKFNRPCITTLKPAQGWALYEAGIANGLFGLIVVGGGKTGLNLLTPMVLDNCKSVVLLVPAKLQKQLRDEYLLWREHWYLPNLFFGAEGVPQTNEYRRPGATKPLPAVHVVSYSKLSQSSSTERLKTLNPDAIICDEGDLLRNFAAARTMRFLRHYAAQPLTRLLVWSGSLMNATVKDVAHLLGLALKQFSPMPLDQDIVEDWAAAIDPPKAGDKPAPPGALLKLCRKGETLETAFQRRLLSTRGVIATHGSDVDAALIMHGRTIAIPDVIRGYLAQLRNECKRPDGFPLDDDSFAIARCARELSSGFYSRWKFPKVRTASDGRVIKAANGRKQSPDLIEEWYAKRKAWSAEVRAKLDPEAGPILPHMDSPELLQNAAERYESNCDSDLPKWKSYAWKEWRDVKHKIVWESEAIWLSDFLLHDCAQWAQEHKGIIWYEHVAFGERLSEITGLPMHAGGPKAEERIKKVDGSTSIVVSRKSHYRGRDGLQYHFHKQLVANPPVSRETGGATLWEQLLGREHRLGQREATVETWIYRHTPEVRAAWDRAKVIASFVSNLLGQFQKINSCEERF